MNTNETAAQNQSDVFNAHDSLTEKLKKISDLGESGEKNKKNFRQKAKEKREAIKELANEMSEDMIRRFTEDPSELMSHFRSIGRFVGKYSKTNQMLIENQRPGTLGVAARGTWERHGYEISGPSVRIAQSGTFLKSGDPAVRKWLDENPLKKVVEWYSHTAQSKAGMCFAEYILDRLKTSENPEFKRLTGEIESYVKKFCRSETPTPEQRKMALEFYTRNKVDLVVNGTSKMGSPEEIVEKQARGEKDGWHMRPPFSASKSLVAFCSVIYGKKIGADAVRRTPHEEERMRKSFASAYKNWSNERYMKTFISDTYSELREKQEKNKEAGIQTPPSERVGFYPIVSSPYFADVYAFEDVQPGPKAKVIPLAAIADGGVTCDTELYEAVKSVFNLEFSIEEVQGVLPDNMKNVSKNGIAVSAGDDPGKKTLEIVRAWSEREVRNTWQGQGQNSGVFKELYALAIMTSLGMNNPYADMLAIKNIPEAELRHGIELAYSNVSDILKRLRKNIGTVIDKKIEEHLEENQIAINTAVQKINSGEAAVEGDSEIEDMMEQMQIDIF